MLNQLLEKVKKISKNSLATGAGVSFIIQILGVAALFVLQMILTNNMKEGDVGKYMYLLSWVGIASIFFSFGFPTSTIKYIARYRLNKNSEHIRGLLFISVISTLGFSILVALALYFIPPLKRSILSLLEITVEDLKWGLGIMICYPLLKLFAGIEKGKKNMVMAHLPFNLLRPVGIVLLILFFIWNDLLTLHVLLKSTFFVLLFGILLHLFRLSNGLGATIFSGKTSYNTKEWLTVSFSLLLVAGIHTLMNQTDMLVVGFMLEKADVAIYSVAIRIASVISFVLVAVNAIAAPTISELYHDGKEKELRKLAKDTAKMVFWPTVALVIVIVLFSNLILSLFGEAYVQGKWTLYILCVGSVVNAMMGSVAYLLNMTGHEKDTFRVFGITALLNLIINPICIYLFRLEGAAIATSFCIIFWNIWLYILVRKRLNISSSIF